MILKRSCFSASVIPLGFEPKTHRLEICCSIQLSYGTKPIGRFGDEGESLHLQSVCKINQYYANCEKKRRILYYS